MDIGFIFPGQGAQYTGMGRTYYDNYPLAKEMFDSASDTLGLDFKRLCFEESQDILTQTVNCQTSIFVVSSVIFRILKETYPEIQASCCGGLSLGEYTALYASGILDFQETLKLIKSRASFMEEASKLTLGGMISIIGLDRLSVEDICKATSFEIANINCPGQIAISGPKENIKEAENLALEKGAKRAVVLNVSGAFHSQAMEPARKNLQEYLSRTEFRNPFIPMVSNVTSQAHTDPVLIKNNLAEQMTGIVDWQGCCQFMIKQGIKLFLEIGPGKVLKGLMRRIDSGVKVVSLENTEDLENVGGYLEEEGYEIKR